MIVKDEEANLPTCLGSVRGIFDEIIVVDTGSTDRTKEVASGFGAKVFDFAWCDDFSAARNASLEHATGDYAFWLDADDVVDPDEGLKIRALIGMLRPGRERAFLLRCVSPEPRLGICHIHFHARLFPIRDDVRWELRLHEQILPSLSLARIPVARVEDIRIRHTGYADSTLSARKKADRNNRILLRDLEDRPDDPFVLLNLGKAAYERKEWDSAIGLLNRSIANLGTTGSSTPDLWHILAACHLQLADSETCLNVCVRGLALDPNDAELLSLRAYAHHLRDEVSDAEACWRQILKIRGCGPFGVVDVLTRRNLAVHVAARGEHAEAEKLMAEAFVIDHELSEQARHGGLQEVESRLFVYGERK